MENIASIISAVKLLIGGSKFSNSPNTIFVCLRTQYFWHLLNIIIITLSLILQFH